MTFKYFHHLLLITIFLLISCSEDSMSSKDTPLDPNTAPKVSVDRFSADAGVLFVRDATNGLPEANAPINMDQAPFITKGLGPNGEQVQYYNFDVQPLESAPIFALFKEGSDTPVDGQLNIIDVIPGDDGYNDFWHVNKVIVPDDYEANTVTSLEEINDKGWTIEKTSMVVNCPVVPEGSTAAIRYENASSSLTLGWYRSQVVFYFNFVEKDLIVTVPDQGNPFVPVSDILVTFNINPGETGGGPSSGFLTEMNSDQTHNVVQTLPEDTAYSPLWDVDIYDNADFSSVSDWPSAINSNILVTGAALVNCPIVSVD